MLESDYRVSMFEKNFAIFKDKNIVLFGAESDTKKLLKRFTEYHFVAAIGNSDREDIFGVPVVSAERLGELDADVAVVVGSFFSANESYKQIRDICKSNNIPVYNLYGWNMQELAKAKSGYSWENIPVAIATHDVISFNLFHTLIEIKCAGQENSNNVLEETAISIEQDLRGRKECIQVLNDAFSQGKKIAIVSDLPWSRPFHERVLESVGIKGYTGLFIQYEEKCGRYDGIYRRVQEEFPEKSVLHIGVGDISDGIMPQMYGINTVVVKNVVKKNIPILSESEYRLTLFEKKFADWKDKRIALYGVGVNTKKVLEHFPEYNFVVLIGEEKEDSYAYNKRVVPLDRLIDLDIDVIIIADMFLNAQRIYRRIEAFCKQMQIEVFNLYGWNMQKLNCLIENHAAQYAGYTVDTLKHEIDKHAVISVDLYDTLVMRKNLVQEQRFCKLEKVLVEQKTAEIGFAEVRRITGNECASSLANLKSIYDKIVEKGQLEKSAVTQAIEIEEQLEIEDIVPRYDMVMAINYAIEMGKKVCIISEQVWSREFHEELLRNIGITGYSGLLISHEERCGKYDGMYRKIKSMYPEMTYLHIGDDEIGDGMMPLMCNMNTFLIKTGLSRFHYSSKYKFDFGKKNWGNNAEIVGGYIASKFNSPFFNSEGETGLMLEQTMEVVSNHSLRSGLKVQYRPDIFLDSEECELVFEKFQSPRVSIIIPVYNQYEYTCNCLKTIHENTLNVTYEVIIADDCSTDKTKEIENYIHGIKVVHNKENLRFLRNCNHAAKMAKGEFILFLNNDTQVQYNWLEPLVRIMDASEHVGMVGSKLVYPDGYLQEAGGIVWKDASAWNYGHMEDPEDAKYNYVKTVDYISGAAIMIRSGLWNQIGGFDDDLAPAYYEDTDLAFCVRKMGYEVVYQPQSVVVHFEGVSNGTDVNTGLKAYQVANSEKFYQKWKDVLAQENFTNGTSIYLAKDRGQKRKQILVVDHYVPNYDKDAGGRCTYMYLKMFVRLGFKVTFIGDNFAKPEPYTTELEQMGIEVLYGNAYYLNIQEWLKGNLPYFDYVYLQRPHISIKYIDAVKKYSDAKVFYFAHDLHHIREYREYLLTHDLEKLRNSQKWKKIEYELFTKADVGHVVGSYEQQVLQEKFTDKPIRNIPLYIYEEMPTGINKNFMQRKDILYVGGFGHTPNIDAVKWFATEIFPAVLKKMPDIKWHVVGGKVPEEIMRLASDNIIIEGFLSDEALRELYLNCRVAVVPLRVGAGVKGKVVEAAYYQIPLLTTSIGAEGLSTEENAFWVEDDAEKFAELLCNVYNDNAALQAVSDNQMKFIEKYFTVSVAESVLKADL